MKVPASIKLNAFNCPYCGALASQQRFVIGANSFTTAQADVIGKVGKTDVSIQQGTNSCSYSVLGLFLSKCFACQRLSVWRGDELISPAINSIESANSDLPDDVALDYQEASGIVNTSPRGAAALLRLAIQKLCWHLGEDGKNINNDIGSLVKKGLMPLVQQSLDALRVIGNEAVHPGTIDIRDDRDTAIQLFSLVNIIADQMITRPKQVQALYDKLPKEKRDAIEKRDG